ncbi:MAG: P-II family nitrogen regulator [Actinomycetota bacterium]
MICYEDHDLIVTIVKRGFSETILAASKEAGAEGGTVIPARGSGIHEKSKLMGIPIEPEKEILLTVVNCEITKKVLDAILEAGNLNKPGEGIVFVLDIKYVAGICHLVEEGAEKEK